MSIVKSSCIIAIVIMTLSHVAKAFEGALTPVQSPIAGASHVDVFVATTRLRGDAPFGFTFGRSHLINYQHIGISIPAAHREGMIEWPRQLPANPATEFAALANTAISVDDFEQMVSRKAASGDGEVTLYVHGYNTSYEAAVLRLGQIAFDAKTSGAAVLFAWPSRGQIFDYLTDRESAIFSRDRLEIVLNGLARQKEVRQINLLAHSMGAFLAIETLRQAKLRGDGEFGGKLNAVVLAAPDIDLDVFRTQLEVIGKRPRPTILLISKDDRALSLSRALSGDVERVGVVEIDSVEAQNEIARLGLTVIDLTKQQTTSTDGHDKFYAMPSTLRFVGGLLGDLNAATQGGIHILSTPPAAGR